MKNNSHLLIVVLLLLLLAACQQNQGTIHHFHPMVDGRNTEYEQLQVIPINISKDVRLYVFQNDAYVWISYDYPEGSFGTLDMIIETTTLPAPLNIHVSAQLGEWFVDDEENIPKTPTSELWWNMNGWIANHLWANGIDTVTYDTPEFKIRNGEIRELQLSKARFGRGEWKIKLKINAIKGLDDQFYSFEFPQDDSLYSLMAN